MQHNPMVSIPVAVWVHIGFLFPRDRRSLLTLVPNVLLSVLQLSYFLFSPGDLATITLNAYFTALQVNCNFRVLFTLNHRAKYERFLCHMTELYDAFLDSDDPVSRHILLRMQFWNSLFSRLNMFLSLVAVVLFVSSPAIIGSPDLPYEIYVQGVDFKTSPAYDVLFGIALVQNLSHKFRTIQGWEGVPDQELIERRFRLYIEYHKRIVRYFDDLNELFATVFLVEILLFGTLLMALLFTVLIAEHTSEALLGCIYIFMIIFQLFAMYYLSNEITEQSGGLSFALYDCPWYTFSLGNRKTLMLVLARTRQPCVVMLGPLAPITLNTFQAILNMSYSYFNLLRQSLL